MTLQTASAIATALADRQLVLPSRTRSTFPPGGPGWAASALASLIGPTNLLADDAIGPALSTAAR